MRIAPAFLGLLLAATSARAAAADFSASNPSPVVSDPASEYARRQLGIEGFYYRGTAEKGWGPAHWQPFEGRTHNQIDPEIFYRKVGRNDLADSYQRWVMLKPVLVVSGIGAVVGGFFLIGRAPQPVGYGLMLGGVTASVVGFAANPHPVGAQEAAALAEGYNQSLAAQLNVRPLTFTAEGGTTREPDVSPAAQAAYAQSFIGFDLSMMSEHGIPDQSSRLWHPFQGANKRKLDHDAFYSLMGRDDLASAYRRNRAVRVALLVAGFGMAITGGVILIGYRGESQTRTYVGAGLAIGGVSALLIAKGFNADPISEAEARQMADEYNRNILRGQGVPIAAHDAPRPLNAGRPRSETRRTWGFLFPTGGGAGMGLAGTF